MRKLMIFVGVVVFFASCGARRTVIEDPAMYDVGVVINGVRWATSNVDTPGIFAKNPESAGGLFTWHEAQDVCPCGWRLPTQDELRSLVNVIDGEWITVNGVDGGTFGTAPNHLFLPAAGWRCGSDGTISFVGVDGHYWSSTQYDSVFVMALGLNSGFVGFGYGFRADGFSVRCVAK